MTEQIEFRIPAYALQAGLKRGSSPQATMVGMRTRRFSLYVAATRVRVWQALTDPATTRRFYFGLAVESDWRPGSPIMYRSADGHHPVPIVLSGEIVHVEPGHRLVHSLLTDTETDREVQSWVTWELEEPEPGICRASLTCDDLDRYEDPERDEAWCRLLSGLKTVLETGAALCCRQEPSVRVRAWRHPMISAVSRRRRV